MSDLQCPATLLVLPRAGWPSHVPLPVDANVAVVYCPAGDLAVGGGLADHLDAGLRPITELVADDVPVPSDGTAAGRSPEDELAAAGDPLQLDHVALQQIADLHRGETVIVVTDRSAVPARRVSIDADGWAVSGLG